ncbi:MAG: hypothetical protein IJZ62_02015 [Clostridia bacterium]|nr:hypothetical protein [Clostridia bacterium]
MTKFFKKHKKKILSVAGGLSLVLMLIIANLLSSLIIPVQGVSESVSANSFEMYLISLSKSQVESEAKAHACDFQKIGAGGYIWEHEGYYHIITSGYLNKADAELVQNSIKLNQNLDSQLLTITFDSYTIYGSYTSEESKVIGQLLSACLNFYSSIYDIAISLDTGVYNEISAKLAVNSSHNTFATTLANFNTIFPKPHPSELTDLYEMTTLAYKIGEKLCGGERINDQQNYSSVLKYRYLEIMRLYFDFCK